MAVTTNYGWPKPALTDAPNGPSQIGALADAVDTDVHALSASTAPLLADTGWLTLPVGLSYNTASSAMMRLKGSTVRMKLLVQLNSGANFPTNVDTIVISAGGLPTAFRPSSQVNFILSASNVGSSVRGFVNSDGSMHFVTQAATGTYVDVAGVRYDVD